MGDTFLRSILEQAKKEAMYGRACVLYARSLELLDQMGLYDYIMDEGYVLE
jgi:phenol 2-monooxygenase